MTETHWMIASAVAGYLIGAVSFARIAGYFIFPDRKVGLYRQRFPGTDEIIETEKISATAVGANSRKMYGCLVAILDILKAAVPILLLRFLFPGEHYHIVYAMACVTGHNFPVYYRFKGGGGESPLLGSYLTINLTATVIAYLAAFPAGFLAGSVFVMRWSGMFFLIPLCWILTRDWWQVAFTAYGVVLFFLTLSRDLKINSRSNKNISEVKQESLSELMMMGKAPGRMLDRYGLPQLIRKWRAAGKSN